MQSDPHGTPRRRLTYANVTATLALVIALAGSTAYARRAIHHFLLSSTSQIKPSVLSQLRGATGPKGATGSTGSKGVIGATGDTGPSHFAEVIASATAPMFRFNTAGFTSITRVSTGVYCLEGLGPNFFPAVVGLARNDDSQAVGFVTYDWYGGSCTTGIAVRLFDRSNNPTDALNFDIVVP